MNIEKYLFEEDDLWRCQSAKRVEEWFEWRWNQATALQQLAIVKAYLQLSSRSLEKTRKKLQQKGGAPDERIIKILAIADSFHDFSKAVMEDILDHVELPTELTIEDLQQEARFLNRITLYKQFHFGNEAITNPFYKAHFYDIQFSQPTVTDENYRKQIRSIQSRVGSGYHMIPMDIWSVHKIHRGIPLQVYKLEQAAEVIGVLRRLIGNEIRCIVDSGDYIVPMITSIHHLDRVIYNKLSEIIHSNLEDEIAKLLRKQEVQMGIWRIIETDAIWFDSQRAARTRTQCGKYRGTEIDVNPTGLITRGMPYTIRLNGIIEYAEGKKMECEIKDIDSKEYRLQGFRKSMKKLSSKNEIKHIIENKKRGTIYAPPIENDIPSYMSSFSLPLLYGMKRSGDWGMVEACVSRNAMFFSEDKYAVMYAYLRGVPSVFIQRRMHRVGSERSERNEGSEHSAQDDSHVPDSERAVDMIQHTFTIVLPRRR